MTVIETKYDRESQEIPRLAGARDIIKITIAGRDDIVISLHDKINELMKEMGFSP